MPWLTEADAITDLRNLLSDGPTDKLAYRKRVIGDANGTNLRFKTFEFRRVTNFTSDPSTSLGVFINGVRVDPTTGYTSDDRAVGEFVLNVTPPANTDYVEASYYVQWFLDSELTIFLKEATLWLTSAEDPTKVAPGLQPAVKYFAAQEAYHKLALRWAQKMSEVYKTEDAPADVKAVIDSYRNLAVDAKKKAVELRDQFYTRQGQALQPLFGTFQGQVNAIVPKR